MCKEQQFILQHAPLCPYLQFPTFHVTFQRRAKVAKTQSQSVHGADVDDIARVTGFALGGQRRGRRRGRSVQRAGNELSSL